MKILKYFVLHVALKPLCNKMTFERKDNYFTENDLDCQDSVGACSDGAASMTCRHHNIMFLIVHQQLNGPSFLHHESRSKKDFTRVP